MENLKGFLNRKNIVISGKRYGIDALGAMAQGLFASLLIGTILNTLGTQLHIDALVNVGKYASSMSGPAMAIAIGYALQAPPLVLFSLAAVGQAANEMGGAGGPLAVLFVAIIAAEFGKAVSKETRVDILVTPIVTILVGGGVYSHNTGDGAAAEMQKKVREIVMAHDWALQFHGFYVEPEKKALRCDVVMSFDIDRKEGVRILTEEISAAYPGYAVLVAPDVDISD